MLEAISQEAMNSQLKSSLHRKTCCMEREGERESAEKMCTRFLLGVQWRKRLSLSNWEWTTCITRGCDSPKLCLLGYVAKRIYSQTLSQHIQKHWLNTVSRGEKGRLHPRNRDVNNWWYLKMGSDGGGGGDLSSRVMWITTRSSHPYYHHLLLLLLFRMMWWRTLFNELRKGKKTTEKVQFSTFCLPLTVLEYKCVYVDVIHSFLTFSLHVFKTTFSFICILCFHVSLMLAFFLITKKSLLIFLT